MPHWPHSPPRGHDGFARPAQCVLQKPCELWISVRYQDLSPKPATAKLSEQQHYRSSWHCSWQIQSPDLGQNSSKFPLGKGTFFFFSDPLSASFSITFPWSHQLPVRKAHSMDSMNSEYWEYWDTAELLTCITQLPARLQSSLGVPRVVFQIVVPPSSPMRSTICWSSTLPSSGLQSHQSVQPGEMICSWSSNKGLFGQCKQCEDSRSSCRKGSTQKSKNTIKSIICMTSTLRSH